jgi:hypothetical protein
MESESRLVELSSGNVAMQGSRAILTVGSSGFVALLDVLGFRSLVMADRQNESVIGYLRVIEEALDDPEIESIVFSDSIILTKQGKDSESLLRLCEKCSILMYKLLDQRIPIRGAIACGDYVRSNVGRSAFVAGKPIIEAYEYEQGQDWIGVMLAPSAAKELLALNLDKECTTHMANDEAFPDLENYLKWKAFLQECNTVPFHGDSRADYRLHSGFAIVPGGSTSLEDRSLECAQWKSGSRGSRLRHRARSNRPNSRTRLIG